MPESKNQFIVRVKRKGLPSEEIRYVNAIGGVGTVMLAFFRNRKNMSFSVQLPYSVIVRETPHGTKIVDVKEIDE